MGWLFAFFGALAGFGIGNGVQANAMAEALQDSFGIPPLLTGIVVALITLAVLVGGIERIGRVTQVVVPVMAGVYVIGALVILIANFDKIPGAFGLIFSNAFTGQAAAGGSLGAVIQRGIARGVFSNESGLGTAPIAQAAAKPGDPVLQGSVAMIGTFVDTIVICSMTALVILISGLYSQVEYVSGAKTVSLTIDAFGVALPGFDWIVVFGTVFFTLTTILGWGYYSEKCLEYIAGVKAIRPFRLVWVAVVVFGAVASGGAVWTIAEILNGLMAIPNLIGLLLLSPVVFRLTRAYDFKTRSQSSSIT